MKRTRILIASDIHNTHIDWYGVKNDDRLERFCRDVKAEYEKDPFEALLLLGDYSLDHWKWDIGGSYLAEKRSRTKEFVDNYLSRFFEMDFPIVMVAGNHEQYSDALWNRLTGFERKDFLVLGDLLFIFLDAYGADLDPTEHSDGTYSPADVNYIKGLMETYQGKKVFLCSHYFDAEKESEEFKDLVKEEERIICLFAGHTHLSSIVDMGEEFGGKKLLQSGNYSYSGMKDPRESMWGFRELIIDGNKLISSYITPENDILLEDGEHHQSYGKQDKFECEI